MPGSPILTCTIDGTMAENRRDFLRKAGAFTAMTALPPTLIHSQTENKPSPPDPILPRRLRPGDRIGLITPGSPVTEEQLADAVKKLEALGFNTFYKPSVLSEYGYFAGRDQERADELMEMFLDPEIDGIWCVRGGYGSIRILNLLDYKQIREHPKVLIGYSDITALLNSIHRQTGLVTFHGPLGVSEFNDFTVGSLKEVVMEPSRRVRYAYYRDETTLANPEFDLYTLREGRATGPLSGGNISVLDSMTGTRFEPDFEGKIVFLEEVEEKTYRVDKMLFHLLEATNLRKAAGIVLGVMSECNINEAPALSLREAIHNLLHPLEIPVVYGLTFGHISHMVTLPVGVKARLNSGLARLRLLDEAVI